MNSSDGGRDLDAVARLRSRSATGLNRGGVHLDDGETNGVRGRCKVPMRTCCIQDAQQVGRPAISCPRPLEVHFDREIHR